MAVVAVIAFVFGTVAGSSAQNEFPVGMFGVNVGFGAGTMGHSGNHWNNVFIPTLNVAGDYSFLPNIINSNGSISGGGYFSIGKGSRTDNNVKCSDFCWRVGTRGVLHYTWVRYLDTYVGVAFGVKHDNYKEEWTASGHTDIDDSNFEFDSYGLAGVRYKLNNNFAFYSEVASTHLAWFQIGVSILFN